MQANQLIILALVLVIVILLFLVMLPRIRRARGDVPEDGLTGSSKPHPFDFSASPANPINEQIVDAVSSMGGQGKNAESEYQENLDRLRRVAEEAVPIIVSAFRAAPEEQYSDRWSLIQLLTDLQHPSAIPALDEVLSAPIPPERSKDPHSFTTAGEEVIIRTAAVEALSRLSEAGTHEALEALLKHSQHENFSVKRASIHAYLAYGGEAARDELLGILPKSDHFILDIKSTDVKEIVQADPESTLKQPEVEDLPRIEPPKPQPGE